MAARIRTSPWVSRSWRLQEGALAQNLYFQLLDRSIRLDWPRDDQIGLPSLTLNEFYDRIKSAGANSDQRLDTFSKMWNGLVNRSTTEAKSFTCTTEPITIQLLVLLGISDSLALSRAILTSLAVT